jgi:apolipoprotein N-acyltransferase
VSSPEILQRRYAGSAAAFIAGVLLALSFAPIGWWPLAILAPAILMWLWDGAAPRRSAVLGFWFNAGTFTVGTYWLYIAIKEIGHAPLWLALFLMVGLVAIMSAYHALLGWFVAKFLPPRGAVRWLVGIPGAWLFIEWWRSWFLSGFGWLALGYAHTDNWLGGLAPVVGQFGLGFVTLVMAGVLVALLLGERKLRMISGGILAAIWIAAFAVRNVEWTEPYSRPIEVAVVQGAIPQDEKWIEGNLENIIEIYRTRTREAHGADLIVWPESAVPDLANNHIEFYRDVYQEASAHGSSLMVGTLRAEANAKTGEEEFFNSVLSMDKSTPGVGWHDKYHLVPFTEFVPVPGFVRQWLKLMTLPYSDFNRGAAQQAPLEDRGPAGCGHHLLRRRLRGHPTARAPNGDVARKRHQRRLVRAFDGALSASADFPHAGARGGQAHGAGRQRRRLGRHRRAWRNCQNCAGI